MILPDFRRALRIHELVVSRSLPSSTAPSILRALSPQFIPMNVQFVLKEYSFDRYGGATEGLCSNVVLEYAMNKALLPTAASRSIASISFCFIVSFHWRSFFPEAAAELKRYAETLWEILDVLSSQFVDHVIHRLFLRRLAFGSSAPRF